MGKSSLDDDDIANIIAQAKSIDENGLSEIMEDPDIAPTEVVRTSSPAEIVQSTTSEDDLEDDYRKARDTLKGVISKGTDALDMMLDIADQSNHPRAFEVFGQLMKEITNSNEKLLDIHKKMGEIKGTNKGPKEVHNNAYFLGTLTDLLDGIEDKEKKVKNGRRKKK